VADVHPIVLNQPRYRWRRRVLRDLLLRPVGFGLLAKPRVTGRDRVPADGPVLIVMNHIGAIDPFVVVGTTRPRYVVPMSKIENYKYFFVRLISNAWGVYPIRRGEVDRQALASTLALLEQNAVVLIAPEGTRQKNGLIQPKEGMTYVATKGDAVIIPAAISYAQGWEKSLKKLRRHQANVRFGRPFKFKMDGRSRVPREELAAMSEEAMYQLALAVEDETMRGYYSDLSKATTNYIEFVQP